MSIFSIALTFFLVTNPIGNTPAIIALVKDFDFERQRKIIMREAIFALLIALFFQFFGEIFLKALNIKDYAVTLCGGILLFLVSLTMIFTMGPSTEGNRQKQEPFFVPIATPILSGPGLMSIIMLMASKVNNNFIITSAILLAWVGVLLVMAIAPYLQRILGKRGLIALEQLMGMVLSFISVGMIVNGLKLFLKTL